MEPRTRQLLPHLPNGRQVILSFGHAGDFWADEQSAGTHLVETYLDSGRVDTSRYAPDSLDFTPSVSHSTIAKILLAVMLGLAGLAALSLLWMAIRVRRRGGYGRVRSALLRSLNAVVLGLGGWFAGALVVLVAFPTTPLDDQALAALSIGLPVGLGIYLASARRGRSLGTKVAGLAAALAGAVVGGWLGFHTMDGLFALGPTVIGAAAGANLAVLALDVARDLRARDRSDVRTQETLDASPSLG